MALYNKDYVDQQTGVSQGGEKVKEEYQSPYHDASGNYASREAMIAFLKQTYQLFAASLLAATAGAYVGMGMVAIIQPYIWGLFFLYIALAFGVYAVKNKPGINLIVLFAFTFVSGLMISPLLYQFFMIPNGGAIIGNAFAMTTVIFGGISLFALSTTRDFSAWGKPLMIVFFVVFAGSLINTFFLQIPILFVAIQAIFVLLFSAFILYDTQNIVKGAYSSPVEAAMTLYVDFFLLFINLLQLLGILSSDE